MPNLQHHTPSSPSQPQVSGKLNTEKTHYVKTPVASGQPSVLLSPSTASNPDTQTSDAVKTESLEVPALSLLSSPSTLCSDTTFEQSKALDLSLQLHPEGKSSTTLQSDNQMPPDFSKDACGPQGESTAEVATTEDQLEDSTARRKAEELLQRQEDALWAQKHEKMRIKYLEKISKNNGNSSHVRNATGKMAKIAKYFVRSAEKAGRQPLDHYIKFGNRNGEGITAQLQQVYALFPHQWQDLVRDFVEGTGLSGDCWLEENLMNTLVHIAVPENDSAVKSGTVFGLSLANCCNSYINGLYQHIQKEDYLDHLIRSALPDLENFANEMRIFAIPNDTKKLVWFWNYDGTHWVTIVTNINEFQWTHSIFDSLDNDKLENENDWGGHVKKGFCAYIERIEKCIQKVSSIPKPMVPRSRVRKGSTPRQNNTFDCGVIAAYNTVVHLKGEKVKKEVNGNILRLYFIQRLLDELQRILEPLSDEESDEQEIREETEVSNTSQHSTETTGSDAPATIDGGIPVLNSENINSMLPDTANAPSSFSWPNAVTGPSSPNRGKGQVEGVDSVGNLTKELEEANNKLVEFAQALPKSRSSSTPAIDVFPDSPPRMNSSQAQTKLEEYAALKSQEDILQDNLTSTPTGNGVASHSEANTQGSAKCFESISRPTKQARTSPSPKHEGSSTPPRPMSMVAAAQQAISNFRKHRRSPSSPDEKPKKKISLLGISKDLRKDPPN